MWFCLEKDYEKSMNFPKKLNFYDYSEHDTLTQKLSLGSLQHSAELIAQNSSDGLDSLSEEGLESNNRDIREYLKLEAEGVTHYCNCVT